MSKNTMLQTRASSHVPVDLDDELAQSLQGLRISVLRDRTI